MELLTDTNIITKGDFKILTKQNIPPTNIEILGSTIDNNILFKYNIGDEIYYAQPQYYNSYNSKKLESYILFEILNNSLLWNIEYEIVNSNNIKPNENVYIIKYNIIIDTNLLNYNQPNSYALNTYIISKLNCLQNFIDVNIADKSFIPYNKLTEPPKNFQIKLYEYQKKTLSKMLNIETNIDKKVINYTLKIKLNNFELLYDPISNLIVNENKQFDIISNGGILADEMGLGKTICSIALILSNPSINQNEKFSFSNKLNINKINSKATLIICPSHLAKQWQGEIIRCCPTLKIYMVTTKTDHKKLLFENIINADIIITTHQFLMNFKYYPSLYYFQCTSTTYNFVNKNLYIKEHIQNNILNVDYNTILKMDNPVFEFFNFHRIILDEGHEIFNNMLSTSEYMLNWLSNIDSNYNWFVSGTPFINYYGIENCARFINLKLHETQRNLIFNYNNKNNKLYFMDKEYIWNEILENICIRHRKSDVENQINIPGYKETIVWIKLTEMERHLYNTKKNKVPSYILQQLCCHPLVVDTNRQLFGSEVNLELMQDQLISYHKNRYNEYKKKIDTLNINNREYHIHKKSYENIMNESKYLYTILERMKNNDINEDDTCSICLDTINDPTLTSCGHLFCYECLKLCLDNKQLCPLCKCNLKGKDLLIVNSKQNEYNDDLNPLITKYGSKLGKLISIIKHIIIQKDTRIIIFSQWDDMLNLIGKTLAENNIENCFVKGNIWTRNSAINTFKTGINNKGNENKVIMLSLKNAASGTNLIEATHIFFVEPISDNPYKCKAIESQAIARACRIGQKNQIMLIRILIENTIEEIIYKNNYDKNVIVSFEEQNYHINSNTNNQIDTNSQINNIKMKKKIKKKIVIV